MRVLYLQPGAGIGGSKISLQTILEGAPAGQASQVALSLPRDPGYHVAISRSVEKIHYLELPTWNAYRRTTWLERIRAPLSHARRLLSLIPATLRLIRIIRAERIDLVHTNNALCPAGALAANLCGVPHVWHIREPIGQGCEYPLIVGDRLAARAFRAFGGTVVCNSQYTTEFLLQNGVSAAVVRNGLDVRSFEAAEAHESGRQLRLELAAAPNAVLIGMVGNLSTRMKRHDLFLECAAILGARYPQCHFVVFGSTTDLDLTPYTQGLKAQTQRLGLESRVTFAGFHDDIPAMMHSIDILVHPAMTEGSGRVVMEAMAAGKPVVAVSAGGARELIEDGQTGLLCAACNAADLSERVKWLIERPEARDAMGRMARLYAAEHFSAEEMMQAITRIYVEALGSQRSSLSEPAELMSP